VGVGVGAFEAMIFGQMVAGTEWADDGIFWAMTVLYVMTKRMAAITLFD